ncbi:MAG: hypothetical protein J5966_05780, partial [Lachnospiraceae bacterium]|nr:hypothetical protein [Lachnospiraceae bacterium]
MIKELRKFDKAAERTVRIKTEKLNEILAGVNAPVKVIPYDVELRNQYKSYQALSNETLSEVEYEHQYFCYKCSFETHENIPAEILISRALGVKRAKVKYA